MAQCSNLKRGHMATAMAAYDDIDMNGHVNSIKYIEHVLDLWPLEWYREHPIHRVEVAYVAESHAGDRLSFYREQTDENTFCVRVCKDVDVEVCRSMVSFR